MPSTRFTRRGVLGLGGSTLALLAGCLGAPVSTGGESETTESATQTTATDTTAETTATSAAADVTVSNVEVTPELVGLNSPDSIGTYGDRDEQFVLVTILVGEVSLPVEQFSLVTDERDFSPIPPDDLPAYGRLWSRGFAYHSRGYEHEENRSGYLVFRVPKPLDSAEVVFRAPGAEFALGETARETLARQPTDFAVSDVTAPDSVESGTEMTISATIENTGAVAGTFVGALNRTGPLIAYTPVGRIEIGLAAGESTTWRHTYRPELDGGSDPRAMRFHLVWRDGRISTETTVEPSS